MQTAPRVEIHFSKKKMILVLCGSLVFVLIGIWFASYPPESNNPLHGNPRIIGFISILLFGAVAVFSLSKIFDKQPALILDSLGLEDRSSLFSAGFILWQDIRSVSVVEIRKQKFIMLELKDPELYIQNQRGFLRKLMLKMNAKMYKGHLAMSSKGLEISIEELHRELARRIV